ncbi:hypothetical protein [Paenibacillus radicis (ex Gao et al. 2016)]|uniref:Uncharacterized protein n=1 Tax=Paenibacillus radicis (ex Gao et al. 2016) TaxID=1737354 RepID=A0A917GTK7_9BACL|nr:hypothetical protein [Paenibacillus radicis (ex Gao et al. 2016)]GGG56016.1 hypothetical protein GCM10010918_06190 [Paenibacillus radicis (ex Gao et al. 2016)]
MKRSALKWTILGGVLVFIVLYAMEMSQSGIERIYGPIEGGQTSVTLPSAQSAGSGNSDEGVVDGGSRPSSGMSAAAEKKIAKLEKELAEVREIAERGSRRERLPGIDGGSHEPAVNKLADGTSGFLQSVTTGGIKFVVSLFDSVTN